MLTGGQTREPGNNEDESCNKMKTGKKKTKKKGLQTTYRVADQECHNQRHKEGKRFKKDLARGEPRRGGLRRESDPEKRRKGRARNQPTTTFTVKPPRRTKQIGQLRANSARGISGREDKQPKG